MTRYELVTHSRINHCQAWHLISARDNHVIALQSYGTIVVSYNYMTGKFKRHWDSSSVTTFQHIRKWCEAMHIRVLDAKHYHQLAIESLED